MWGDFLQTLRKELVTRVFTLVLQENKMEELLFYQYLEHQKTHVPNFKKRFLTLPPTTKLLCLGTFVSAIIGIILLFKGTGGWAAFFVLLECTCSLSCEAYMEHFKTVRSKARSDERFAEWYQLKDWLAKTPVSDADKISEIKGRVEQLVEDETSYRLKKSEQIEKWIQCLVFPLVLVIGQKIINEQTNISVYIAVALTIFTVCGILYGLVKLGTTIWSLTQILRLRQLSFFAEDLQGVLDLDRFGIERPLAPVLQFHSVHTPDPSIVSSSASECK